MPGGGGRAGARGYVGGSERGGGRIPPRPAAACASLAGPLFAQDSQLPLAHAAAYKAEPEPAAGQRRRQRPAAPGPPSPPPPPVPVRPPRPAGTMRAAALLLLALLPLRPLPGRAARPKLALPIRPDTEPLPPGGAAGRSPLPSTLPSPAPRTPGPVRAAAAPPVTHPASGTPSLPPAPPSVHGAPAPPSSGAPRSAPGPPAGRDRRWDRHRQRGGRWGGAGRSGAAAGGARGPEVTGDGGGMSAGCAFGGHFYALEETWHPDLGEPFGVMRCVICHCEPVSAPTHPVP